MDADEISEATKLREEHAKATREFAAHVVTHDIREGATSELPDRAKIEPRTPGIDDVPPTVWETVTGAAGRTMTGTELADLVVEAAPAALPDAVSDDAWHRRYSLGNHRNSPSDRCQILRTRALRRGRRGSVLRYAGRGRTTVTA
ncbi:hypothetical protein ACFRI7_03040 [Streptomyces sp. NPDC056716]|uniref:hypothetical protein n=1 Tax=unclassified Streptomyces TaxID=2593676 RepID=UPI0036C6EBA8